jgi:hypothetical protein
MSEHAATQPAPEPAQKSPEVPPASTQALAPVPPAPKAPELPDRPFDERTASLIELKEVARLFAASSQFKDVQANNPAQAFTKMMIGRDMKIPMTRALVDVQMIQGKPTLSANLMAGMIKASGKYRFKKVVHTDQECSIEVFERVDGQWESLGVSSFTMKDAQTAKLTTNPTWQKFPKNMLFSRVISNIAKQECGDVFLGSVYTPDELDPRVEVDEDGDPVLPKAKLTRVTTNGGTDAPAFTNGCSNEVRASGSYLPSKTETVTLGGSADETTDAEFVEASPAPGEETQKQIVEEIEALATETKWDLAGFLKGHRLTTLKSLDLTSLKNTRNNLRQRKGVMAGAKS